MNACRRLQIAVVVVALVAVRVTQQSRADELLSIGLLTSDAQVYVNDGLSYKVVITNESRSQVTIAGPRVLPQFSCLIEYRVDEGEWVLLWDDLINGQKAEVLPAPIKIAAGLKWAEYGQVFLTKGKKHVFHEVGKPEIRAKVTCAIGTFLSKPIPIDVIPWPASQLPLDKRFVPVGHLVLDETMPLLERHFENLTELCGRYPSGGVAKSLKLFLDVESYEKDGAVAGKVATRAEAFKVLSPGLDEVRRDQLAFLLGNGARKAKQWKDVAALLGEIKDESSRRRSLQGELDGAIQTGQYRGR
ncbi:MAG: hypothetical protein ACR2FY_19080 [Pirellulaceae bacterium]